MGTSAVSVVSTSTFDLNGFNQSVGSISGAGTITNTGGAATLTTGGDNTSTTFSGQLTAKGYGGTKPVVPNSSPANMARNRRVEFVVLNPQIFKRGP